MTGRKLPPGQKQAPDPELLQTDGRLDVRPHTVKPALPVHFADCSTGKETARQTNGAWLLTADQPAERKEEKARKKMSGSILIFMNFLPAQFSSFD